MKLRISLRGRIMVIVAALTLLSLGGGLFSVWFAWSTNRFLSDIIGTAFANLEAARALDASLAKQRGFLSYYLPEQQTRLEERLLLFNEEFNINLMEAYTLSSSKKAQAGLKLIGDEYHQLADFRLQALRALEEGRSVAALDLRWRARVVLDRLMELTSSYEAANRRQVDLGWLAISNRIDYLTHFSLTGVVLVVLLGIFLAVILLKQVLEPIRRLAQDGGPFTPTVSGFNEVAALRRRVVNLWENFDRSQNQLALSREQLLQAAKLASVGKLAAGVAHSIRNPLTAVKMRLFSLERTLDRDHSLTETQKDDLAVIAQEMANIDTIVTNFLEFSRRPKLNLKTIDPARTVSSALTLLRQRLESYGVEVIFEKPPPLPLIEADADQLREVLVNLIINACEAITDPQREDENRAEPGRILIRVGREDDLIAGRVFWLEISDNGPGVPPEAAENVFNPFFTTKEEGTGLGLAIALRIIEEHGGVLDLLPDRGPGGGAGFVIHLPVSPEDAPPSGVIE